MLRWYPSLLLRVILELTFVPIAFLTIFAVKALADRQTPWSVGPWSGPGASPDFWKLLAVLAVGWLLLVLGWRGAKTGFKYLIGIWHLSLTAASLITLAGAEDFVVRGEAMGFQLSLGVLAPVYTLTTLVCTLVWISQDHRRGNPARSVSPLQRRNRIAAGLGVIALVVAWVAFARGANQLGVIASLAMTLAGHEAMRPVNPSAELHKVLVGEGSAPE
jgi:hypothetical protein